MDTTESTNSASYLDLLLSIGRDGLLHTSIYDKRDDFNFHITNFPFLSSNIPWSIWGSYSAIWSIPLTNVKWYSDPWPTVTSQPIRLSTNIMTFYTELELHRLRVVSMEHLQRVWHANRERLPFRTPGSVPPPPSWDLLVLQLLRPDSSNLPCLYSTCHLEYPLVISRFSFIYNPLG